MLSQEQLNESIARELDNNQVHLEYMRIRLDEDKELRKSLNWLVFLKKAVTWGILPAIIESIGQFGFGINWVKDGIIAIGIILLVSVLIVVFNIKKLNQLLSDKNKEKYQNLIKQQSAYLSKLESWLVRLDSRKRAKDVNGIELDFATAKTAHDPILEEISELNGILNDEWDKKAHQYAEQRLVKLKPYIYDNRSNT